MSSAGLAPLCCLKRCCGSTVSCRDLFNSGPPHTTYLGICGLERLQQSSDAETVLASRLAEDEHRDLSVAGNCLMDESVLEAMEQASLTSDPSLKLGRRLMRALQAGEVAGGDRHSNLCTSAAVQVSGEAAFPLLDLRVDSTSTPWSS